MSKNFQKSPTSWHNIQSQMQQDTYYLAPATTPLLGIKPAVVDPYIRERVERYVQWLLLNNKLPVSPQKLQAYQDAALETKKVGKHEVRPFAPFQERTSALHVMTSDQIAMIAILAVCWSITLIFLHLMMLAITLGIVTLLYLCGFVTSGILVTKSFHSSSGETIDEKIIHALDQLGVKWPTYTILCPLYKETVIVPQFVEAIKALHYPLEKLQVLFLTEENDSETRATLDRMHLPASFIILTVPKGVPQTKPRACNFGLLQAKGQFIVIFDAEDIPDPLQLKKAVLTFANHEPEVACVQAKLNFYNPHQNLLTRLFTAEYSLWFDLILPGLQRIGYSIPLGGTSNHFQTRTLRALGGWDAFNVTEYCDLGLRLHRYNLQTVVLNSITYEEANSQFRDWLRQRSRWVKGYMQSYLVHMRNPFRYLSSGSLGEFLSMQIMIGGKTAVLFLNPLLWLLVAMYFILRPVVGDAYQTLFPQPLLYLGTLSLIF